MKSIVGIGLVLLTCFFVTGAKGADTGTVGGGGGYVTDNSLRLLKVVSATLAADIRNSSEVIFSQILGSKLSKAQLASLIENIRIQPREENSRDGIDLVFDYGWDQQGPYISALRTYFLIYGAIPMKFKSEKEVSNIALDLRLKLLHEAAHVLDIGQTAQTDAQADRFAIAVLRALAQDVVYCTYENKAGDPPSVLNTNYWVEGQKDGDKPVTLGKLPFSRRAIFHRLLPNRLYGDKATSQRCSDANCVAGYLFEQAATPALFASNFLKRFIYKNTFSKLQLEKDSVGDLVFDFPSTVTIGKENYPMRFHLKISEHDRSSRIESFIEAPSLIKKPLNRSLWKKFRGTPSEYTEVGPAVRVPIQCQSLAVPLRLDGTADFSGDAQEFMLDEYFAKKERFEDNARMEEHSRENDAFRKWERDHPIGALICQGDRSCMKR